MHTCTPHGAPAPRGWWGKAMHLHLFLLCTSCNKGGGPRIPAKGFSLPSPCVGGSEEGWKGVRYSRAGIKPPRSNRTITGTGTMRQACWHAQLRVGEGVLGRMQPGKSPPEWSFCKVPSRWPLGVPPSLTGLIFSVGATELSVQHLGWSFH